MSDFETKDGSGALFKNERKEPDSKQPDYTGNARIHGQMVDVSAWIKKSKAGKPYMSLSFKPPYVKPARGGAPARGPALAEDEELPFITNGSDR